MATTVAEIAKKAYDNVSAVITDAIQSATIGAETGRIVFEREKAPKGYVMPSPEQRIQSAWLEGFTVAPAYGDTLVSGGVNYFVMGVNDVVKAGTFFNVMLSAESDMLWSSVEIQRNTKTSDGAGGWTDDWNAVATVDAGIIAIGGSESWQFGRIEDETRFKVVMEYRADLKTSDALVFDGRFHNIRFVDNVQERGIWLSVDVDGGVATRATT